MPYKNPVESRNYKRNWMNKRRNTWLNYMGGKCVSCGSTERLEFDHIDRSTKKYEPRMLWSRQLETIIEELMKCQLLCHECHLIKTRIENTKIHEHGSYTLYKTYKCRCELCRAANAARVKKQRANKKAGLVNV
jgi:hypothetical protein